MAWYEAEKTTFGILNVRVENGCVLLSIIPAKCAMFTLLGARWSPLVS
jgi:hypothetical protein